MYEPDNTPNVQVRIDGVVVFDGSERVLGLLARYHGLVSVSGFGIRSHGR